MKKNGVYFRENKTKTEKEPEKTSKRGGMKRALIFAAFTLAAVFIYIVVRTKGAGNLIPLLLVLAVTAVCIEIAWSEPNKKSYVLWKKLFNKE